MYRISILNRIYIVYFVYFLIMKIMRLAVLFVVQEQCDSLFSLCRSAQSGKWGPARHRRAHNARTQAEIK